MMPQKRESYDPQQDKRNPELVNSFPGDRALQRLLLTLLDIDSLTAHDDYHYGALRHWGGSDQFSASDALETLPRQAFLDDMSEVLTQCLFQTHYLDHDGLLILARERSGDVAPKGLSIEELAHLRGSRMNLRQAVGEIEKLEPLMSLGLLVRDIEGQDNRLTVPGAVSGLLDRSYGLPSLNRALADPAGIHLSDEINNRYELFETLSEMALVNSRNANAQDQPWWENTRQVWSEKRDHYKTLREALGK
jgi:hypothetical protein